MIRDEEYGLVSSWEELQMLRRLDKEIDMPRVTYCRYVSKAGIRCHRMATRPNHYCEQHISHEAEYQAKRDKWQAQDNKRRQQRYDKSKRVRDETKQEQVKFYRSKHWRALRQVVLERDHYLCQYCLAHNRMTSANTVDHIVPYEFNQSKKDNVDNLAVICRQCHYGKSKWERDYYGTGTGNELKNVVEIGNVNLLPDFMDNSKTTAD